MSFVVLGTAIWMAADAAQIGYDKDDIKGLAAIGPAGWFFAGLLLWIVAFPLYLIKRPELKAAAERRRQWMLQGGAARQLPGQVPGAYGQPGYGPPGYGQPGAYGPNPYGPNPYGPGAYGQGTQGHPGGGYQSPYAATGPYAVPQAGGTQPAGAAPTAPDVVEEIKKLDELRRAGLLTDAEFQQKKSDFLARI